MSSDTLEDLGFSGSQPGGSSSEISANQGETKPRARAKRSLFQRVIMPVLLVLAGAAIMLYPVIATQYNNAKQRDFSEKYSAEMQHTDPEYLKQDIASAQAYNSHLPGVPILDPWLLEVAQDPGSEAYKAYVAELSRGDVMARVMVPSVNIDLPVYHGTTDAVIGKGAGHLYGTSLPVGGQSTHAVLTSHTGMPNATLFDNLDKVKEGDLIIVEVSGETIAYKVDQIKVVLPQEISDLTTVQGKDYLTLFTCTPYAVNSHRLLVRGERVDYTPEVAEVVKESKGSIPMASWQKWLIAGAATGILLLIVVVIADRRRRKNAEKKRMALAS